jgi:hypothetical protein
MAVVVVYFDVTFQYLPGGPEEGYSVYQVRLSSDRNSSTVPLKYEC